MIDTGPLAYEKQLGRFVCDPEYLRNFIGDVPVGEKVEKIKRERGRRKIPAALQAAQCHSADGAAGAVLEYHNTRHTGLRGEVRQLVELLLGSKLYPAFHRSEDIRNWPAFSLRPCCMQGIFHVSYMQKTTIQSP
jgi:hypothetical protein